MTVKKKSVGARLQRKLDGHLKSQAEVKRALKRMQQIADEIAEVEARNGLVEMREEAVRLKKAATDYMVEHELDDIQLGDGSYAKIIRAAFDRQWVLYAQDLESAPPEGFRSLRSILRTKFGTGPMMKKVWSKATQRVADPAGIQELVREGEITEEELAPAYVERERAPYLRIFGEME